MRLGGGNNTASESSLWKPTADNGGNLVVILPHSKLGVIKSVTVGGEKKSIDSIGNGWRPHFRFSKPGAAYSGSLIVETSTGTYRWVIDNPFARREPIPLTLTSTLNASELTASTPTQPAEPAMLYSTTANSITLRSDLAAVVSTVDMLHLDGTTPVAASRSGNTWTIPDALSSYPHGEGDGPNAWRIRLTGVPPAGVTYHTSMMQTFVSETNIAEGKGRFYPPTTRY